jgi:protein-S-isoprenylcysteine O-methyltransferase Ste14
MTPLPFVWPYGLLYWATMVWAMSPEFGIVRRAMRSVAETPRSDVKDAKSLQVILVGLQVAMLGAYFVAWVPALQISGRRIGVFLLGVALLIAGSLLRRHCWRMLGSSFTGDVRASADQQVVTRGAYSMLRHPSYTAAIIMNTGMGVALGSWASVVLLVVASFVVYSYRMTVEERALLAAIGAPYQEFMRTRKRVIPFIY